MRVIGYGKPADATARRIPGSGGDDYIVGGCGCELQSRIHMCSTCRARSAISSAWPRATFSPISSTAAISSTAGRSWWRIACGRRGRFRRRSGHRPFQEAQRQLRPRSRRSGAEDHARRLRAVVGEKSTCSPVSAGRNSASSSPIWASRKLSNSPTWCADDISRARSWSRKRDLAVTISWVLPRSRLRDLRQLPQCGRPVSLHGQAFGRNRVFSDYHVAQSLTASSNRPEAVTSPRR